MKVKFNNVQNKEIVHEGKTYWISRSVAVIGMHIALTKDGNYVLVQKRSNIMDQPNKWALPGGYIDWNENAYEAVTRETYEETGWYFPEGDTVIFSNGKNPVMVNTEPGSDPRQNITLVFLFIHNFKNGLPDIEGFTNAEVDQVKWLSFDDFYNDPQFTDPSDWAFNHDKRIRQVTEKYAHLIG